MKKSKFTEALIAFVIKQSETGTRMEEVCRKMGISEATFYNWRKEYNTFRRYSCLSHLTSEMFIEKQVKTAEFPTLEHS